MQTSANLKSSERMQEDISYSIRLEIRLRKRKKIGTTVD